jgi:hypothetical protein
MLWLCKNDAFWVFIPPFFFWVLFFVTNKNNMVKNSPLLFKQISNKVWNATIKIPELKTTLPAFESTFDQNEATDLLTDMFKQYKGRILVVTGAGNIIHLLYMV